MKRNKAKQQQQQKLLNKKIIIAIMKYIKVLGITHKIKQKTKNEREKKVYPSRQN